MDVHILNLTNTAVITFEHDLEDGWYRMRGPDGSNRTWDTCSDAHKYAKSQGWNVVWDGDEYYKPRDLEFDT